MIVGMGVDVCEVERIRRAVEAKSGRRFVERVFTEGERAYCEARKRGRFESYAARFAAKEAAMKALGTGWGEGIGWRDVEVVREGDGAPVLRLHGAAAALAQRRRMRRWHVSLTHSSGVAMAWVIAEDGPVVRRPAAGRRATAAKAAAPRPTPRRRSR
jgi:holo-[acyl-carrier protein] synthase